MWTEATLRTTDIGSVCDASANGDHPVQLRRRTGARSAGGDGAAGPLEECKTSCGFMRLYTTLRCDPTALLLAAIRSIVTALASAAAVRTSLAHAGMLKAAAPGVSLAFLVIELRASSHSCGLRDRTNALLQQLRFRAFAAALRCPPMTTSGAGFFLPACVALLWLASLFFRLEPGARCPPRPHDRKDCA